MKIDNNVPKLRYILEFKEFVKSKKGKEKGKKQTSEEKEEERSNDEGGITFYKDVEFDYNGLPNSLKIMKTEY